MTGESTECRHCWHHTGMMQLSLPPRVEEICCHCGEKRYLRVLVEQEEHGSFAPHSCFTASSVPWPDYFNVVGDFDG